MMQTPLPLGLLPAVPMAQIAFAKLCSRYDQQARSCSLHGHCHQADLVEHGIASSLTGCDDFTDRPVRDEGAAAVKLPCGCLGASPLKQGGAAGTDTVLNMGAGGLGDGLQGLLAASALKQDHPGEDITYKCGPKALPFVRLFSGWDKLALADPDQDGLRPPRTGDVQLNLGYQAELRARGHVKRWERFASNAGLKTGTPLPMLALKEPERIAALGKDCEGAIVLAPFSSWGDREWALPHWLALEQLFKEKGCQTVVLDVDPAKCRPFRGKTVAGANAERATAAVLNASAFVGNDSGLSHLAGVLGKPSIVLCGQTIGESIYGCYGKQVRCLHGALPCSGCYWQSPHQGHHCRPRCPNIQTITPATVLAEIDRLLLPAIAGHRSLLSSDKLAVARDCVLKTSGISGDLAEFGVYKGGTAKLICHFAAGTGAVLHLFDTFAGMPANDEADHGQHKAGDFADTSLPEVLRCLEGCSVMAFPGIFPETAKGLEDCRYRFAHVDLDSFQGTAAALDFLLPRMASGGVILLDDYGWWKTPGVAAAVHARVGEGRISRPTLCQAVVQC